MEKNNEPTKEPADFKRGAGTLALTLIGLGAALAVRGALSAGTSRGYWGATTASGVQTALGATVALVGGAMKADRSAAAVGAANVALGGERLIEDIRFRMMQAPGATGTPAPTTAGATGTPAPTTAGGGRLAAGGVAPGFGPSNQRVHAQYRG